MQRSMASLWGIVRLSTNPSATLFAYPLFCVTLFLIANGSLYGADFTYYYPLFLSIVIALLSNFGANLWNHTNDIVEDRMKGKSNALSEGVVKRETAIITAVIFYLISLSMAFLLSKDLNRPIFHIFVVWCIITWWYSDNLVFKKIIGFRLKDHYITEFITYSIAYPTFILSIWLIFADIDLRGLSLAVIFFFYGISGVLLKDLKDISGDRDAGLMTFGVALSPSRLLYLSSILLIFYYLSIIVSSLLSILSLGSVLVVIPFLFFMVGTFGHFHKKDWKIESEDFKPIQNMMLTTYASLLLLGFGNIF